MAANAGNASATSSAPFGLAFLRALTVASLVKLFALQTHVPAELQPLFAAFDPDVSAVWEPDEDFFKRLPRESLTAALGEAAIPDVTPSKKKRELVEMAIRQLLPLGWLPKPLRTPCYKGPGSNAWADAHAAMTADQIAAKHAPAPAPKGKAKPKAATRAKPVKKVAKSPARKTTKRKGK